MMGYSTDFTGELKFAEELTATALAKLAGYFGEDCRDHPEWSAEAFGRYLYYIDLELTPNFDGIRYNNAEKTSLSAGMINLITSLMREEYPEFRLTGELLAQGEDIEDRWRLVMDESGYASRVPFPKVGDRITCPHCERQFIHEESRA